MDSSNDAKSTGKSPPMGKSNEGLSTPPPAPAPSPTPLSPKYVCRSPLCRSPDVPLTDFDSMEFTIRDLLWMTQRGPRNDFRERVARREYADARLLERMILRFCCEGDLFEEVKRKLRSVEVEREMVQSVDDVFDDRLRAQAGKRSMATLLTEYLDACQHEVFGLLQRTILARRTPGDLWNGFCLHDVYRNKSTFEAIVSGWDRQELTATDLYKGWSLWFEIRAGMLSGRITGVGWTLEERSEGDMRTIFDRSASPGARCQERVVGRLEDAAAQAIALITPGRMSSLVAAYCEVSNDRGIFAGQPLSLQLSSDIERLDLSSISKDAVRSFVCPMSPSTSSPPSSQSPATPTSANPRPPTSSSPLPSKSDPSYPFENLTNPNPFESLGLIVQPTQCCPPDKCSGQRPIEANYHLVEKLLESFFGFAFLTYLVGGVDVTMSYCTAGGCVSEAVDSLEVGTAEQRRIVLEALPTAVTEDFRESECYNRIIVSRLYSTLCMVKSVLRHLQGDRQPCLCDLTHLCDPLSSAVRIAKAQLGPVSSCSVLSNDQSIASQNVQRLMRSINTPNDRQLWRQQPDWKDHVKDFADFVAEPLATLVSTPSIRLTGYDRSTALLMLLGPVRLLQQINSVDIEDETLLNGERMSCTRGVHYLLGYVLHHPAASVQADAGDQMRKKVDKRLGDSKFSLMDNLAVYAAAFTINPTDYLARLNSAALRLRNTDRTSPDSDFSAVVCDTTMALYYGPPSYKAYYRRGYALARLRMWDKAILDFERALALEPHNEFLKERLRLARMKRS